MFTRSHVLMGVAGAALVAPAAALAVFRAFPRLDPPIMAFDLHFYAVSVTALAAAVACGVVMLSAKTLQNTRLVFLGLAFLAIAGIFAVHGLETPGFIAEEYYASVAVSAWLSTFVGAAFVALSVATLPHRIERLVERNGRAIFASVTALVAGYIAMSIAVPSWLDGMPVESNGKIAIGLVALGLGSFAIWRYCQAYQFARLPSQLAMIAALVLLLDVQAIILWGGPWHLSWWIYHAVYAVAFMVLFAGWAMEAQRAGTLRAIADALSMRDALAQLNRGLDAPILELVDTVEVQDRETFGHVRRVSGYALAIGKRLKLGPSALRGLAMAAQMHDVGKISIPSSILAKPGPLTAEEYAVVKTHTLRGHEIAEHVAALRELSRVIRHHHERYDGSGYPDGLAGEAIPLFSRIIAVADTYDAMTSKRPYRDGAGHGDAIAEIRSLRGRQFDPQCVDAFLAVFDEPGTRLAEEIAA